MHENRQNWKVIGSRYNGLRRIFQGLSLLLLLSSLVGLGSTAEPVLSLRIEAAQPGARINPAMWGIFFEDINFGADGGLYAELVKNRSFEFREPLMGWSKVQRTGASGSLKIRDDAPAHPANPHFVRVKADTAGEGFGLSNEGFSGMGVRAGEIYHFTVQARSSGPAPKALRIELLSAGNRPLATAKVSEFTSQWQRYALDLTVAATEPKARLVLLLEGQGTLDLDTVSLFPAQTWRNRPNGLRADLVQVLAELKPGFMRFPGGCIVEGRYLSTRYQWKKTLGDPAERPFLINRWNDEFKHRPAPDYFQSFGLGFFEYFQLCEDIGAEPLPILNCGMACQFNSRELVALKKLEPYIQDALDLIEFANGSAATPWGSRRAAMGHPQPFKMKLLGVGNEQWGPQYVERYAAFGKALKDKHPEIQLVSSAGPRPDDELFQFLWPKLRELKADIVDEHCYANPEWFLNNAGRYDGRARSGSKVFMGEFAAQSIKVVSPDNRNDWGCALAEAAYMSGLERNADLVVMASYAPLLAHVERWQWKPNLIWFDNLRVFGTPSYYVQQLFSCHRGDAVAPVRWMDSPSKPDSRLYASATRDEKAGELILKLVNASAQPVEVAVELAGVKAVNPKGRAIVLSSSKLSDENTLENPRQVGLKEELVMGLAPQFRRQFKPYSVTVLRIPVSAP